MFAMISANSIFPCPIHGPHDHDMPPAYTKPWPNPTYILIYQHSAVDLAVVKPQSFPSATSSCSIQFPPSLNGVWAAALCQWPACCFEREIGGFGVAFGGPCHLVFGLQEVVAPKQNSGQFISFKSLPGFMLLIGWHKLQPVKALLGNGLLV